MEKEKKTDLLTGFEDNLVRASMGKRLLNYIIDLVVYGIIAQLIMSVSALINPKILITINKSSIEIDKAQFLLNTSIYIGYMFLSEAILNGKSLGKFITNTKAVNLDGSKIDGITALKRALIRVIPFSVFSAIGKPCKPWWDTWTNTIVINEKLSTQ